MIDLNVFTNEELEMLEKLIEKEMELALEFREKSKGYTIKRIHEKYSKEVDMLNVMKTKIINKRLD